MRFFFINSQFNNRFEIKNPLDKNGIIVDNNM